MNFSLETVVGSTHKDLRASAVLVGLGSVEKKVDVLAPKDMAKDTIYREHRAGGVE